LNETETRLVRFVNTVTPGHTPALPEFVLVPTVLQTCPPCTPIVVDLSIRRDVGIDSMLIANPQPAVSVKVNVPELSRFVEVPRETRGPLAVSYHV
jgi:hypothetical protein